MKYVGFTDDAIFRKEDHGNPKDWKEVSVDAWCQLSRAEWEAVEAEAAALPLPGIAGRITVERS